MTITEFPPTRSDVDGATAIDGGEAQLLIPEAGQRRRRRWLIPGTVAVDGFGLVSAIVDIVFGRGAIGSVVSPATAPPPASATSLTASQFSVRPIRCLAPPASVDALLHAGTPLPAGTAASSLIAGDLQVDPESSSVSGFSTNLGAMPSDPRFSSPINEPTQSTLSSFSGRIQIAAGLTRPPAMALAARL